MPSSLLTVHVSNEQSDIVQTGLDTAESVGIEVFRTKQSGSEDWPSFPGKYDTEDISFKFDISADREPYERVLCVVLGEVLPSRKWSSSEGYAEFVDVVIDLACELSVAYDAEYVALCTSNTQADIAPSGVPFVDHIDQIPSLAVYSEALLTELGGLETLYDGEPWRYAKLDSEHVFAMTADSPWQDSAFTDSERRNLHHGEADSISGLSDPFATLDPDTYGTDAVIIKADMALGFTNDALTLERCYRDETGALRRVADDSFVRRVVTDDGPVGDLPAGVDPDDERISALMHGTIPPAFVRCDHHDDPTVVSRVLNLDIQTSKYDVLVSLAQTACTEHCSDDILDTIDQVRVELERLDGQDGIDAYIQQNLL